MIYRIINWWETREAEQRLAIYKDGYGWAWMAFFLEGRCLAEIESIISDEENPFDSGVKAACRDIAREVKAAQG